VTGSRHLLETDQTTCLLDCGTFQGSREMRQKNREFSFDPASINHVILSHAHIDHCGMLPLLVKRGFKGKIHSTAATRDVAELMLMDVAWIETQDAEYRRKHKIGDEDDWQPLFIKDDIPQTMKRWHILPYVRENSSWNEIGSGVRLKLYEAGHILGSAVIVLELDEAGKKKTLAYTGDMGPKGMPLLYDPQVPVEEIDTLLMESTYGSRDHEPTEQAEARLAASVSRVIERGGRMIVPAFSLGRTQGIVYVLHRLTDTGQIPRLPIYVDSPLAVNLTDVYREHQHDYDEESRADFAGEDHRPLAFRNLTYTRSVQESKALNKKTGALMIISASGMMTAGRVIHHLKHAIEDERNAILITGFQAQGTLGRRILEGEKKVKLHGQKFEVKAEVMLFNEFSAHADQRELRSYAARVPGLKNIFLVHGEAHQADDLKLQLQQANPEWQVIRPDEGESFEL